jgi:hypothetical protein
MNYYDKFPLDSVHILKDLNEKLIEEESKDIVDKKNILKIKQQILMKGLEMSVGFNFDKYNPR